MWLKHNQPIPYEEVLAEFGLTMADWDRMNMETSVGESEAGMPDNRTIRYHTVYGEVPRGAPSPPSTRPNMNAEIQHARQLLDYLAPNQVAAVVHLMEVMLDPVSRALANAPIDDEPVTEEEERAVAEAREWLKHNPGIPFEQVVAELGFTMEEVENYQDPA